MVLLAAAYALTEEGGRPAAVERLLRRSGPAFVPQRRAEPWLGRVGLTVVGALYVLGAGLVFWGNYYEERFLASLGQLAGIGAVIVALVVAAYAIKGRRLSRLWGSAPSPWIVGVTELLLTSAWWGPAVLVTAGWYESVGVAVWVLVATVGVVMVSRWSPQTGWDDQHRLALAGGALLTYVWASFPVPPEGGGSATVDLVRSSSLAPWSWSFWRWPPAGQWTGP
jgi:hypothetical protein